MTKCPKCKNGKISITSHTRGEPKENDSTIEIDCVHCNGTGQVDQHTLDIIEFEDNMWCKCENSDEWPKSYKNGEHPEIYKHHYRCRKCNGVVQIG